MKITRITLITFAICALSGLGTGAEIEQWKRFEVQYKNNSWRGNPFDIVLKGIFTGPSGEKMTQFGFYVGKDTWSIYFMPDQKGKWVYQTHCDDPDLDGKSGEFMCVDSELKGSLIASGNRWKLKGDGGDFPIIWSPPIPSDKHGGFRGRQLTDPEVQKALQFAHEVVGARLLDVGTIVIAPVGWAKNLPQSAVPYVVGKEGEEFYLPFWDQLNAKLDAAREYNIGAYIMLYSDDEQKPDNFGLAPRSSKELRLFRYVVARLACYPHILWDSGIDIGEYRNVAWINWYADWFNRNDPWRHPVGSRTGGGSGGVMPEAATYFSAGGAYLPSRQYLLDFFKKDVPVAHTDHWRPFHPRGNWTHQKIRVALWRCGLTGAQALLPDYNKGKVNDQELRTGAKYIGFATHFFRNELRSNLLELEPQDDLLLAGSNAIMAANPGQEYVVYDEDGGEVLIDMTLERGTFEAYWYNPRTGNHSQSKMIKAGKAHSFSSPTKGSDWVLHIFAK
jgi:Domain of unknown function (DUF5060)/Putative collagen-binding domain of a collagenase